MIVINLELPDLKLMFHVKHELVKSEEKQSMFHVKHRLLFFTLYKLMFHVKHKLKVWKL